MTKLFIGAGRDVGVMPRDLVAAINNEVGINPQDIGTIDVAERFSLVEVPGEIADYVIDTLQGVRIRGRKVQVRRDRDGQFGPRPA